MLVKLHTNAALTPAKRAHVRASGAPAAAPARELGVSETTVRRWKVREDTADRSSRPRRLQTAFTAEEEEVVRELRSRLRLSLDDMLEAMRRCVRADISRSALHRCVRRLGLPGAADPSAPEARPFEAAPFGHVHADPKHLTRLEGRPAYVFVAIERATRFAHVEVVPERSGAAAAACRERFLQAFGHPVHTVLTDNGSEFTDRFGDARWRARTTGTGRHPFDRACARHGVRHKPTRPYRPQTNGMAERFNRRVGDALAAAPPTAANCGRNRFATHQERDAFVRGYNRTRLRCLGHRAPAELLANLPGHNTSAETTGKGQDSCGAA